MAAEKATIDFKNEDGLCVTLECEKKEEGWSYVINVDKGGDLDGFYADLAAAFIQVIEGGKDD